MPKPTNCTYGGVNDTITLYDYKHVVAAYGGRRAKWAEWERLEAEGELMGEMEKLGETTTAAGSSEDEEQRKAKRVKGGGAKAKKTAGRGAKAATAKTLAETQ